MRKRNLASLVIWTLQANNGLADKLAQRLVQDVVAACRPLCSMELRAVC